MFDVGQHVICIMDHHPHRDLYPTVIFPVKGSVYTVREVMEAGNVFTHEIGIGIYLDEIANDLIFDGEEPCFSIKNFRPVNAADLDVFRSSLETAPADGEFADDAERRKVRGWEVA